MSVYSGGAGVKQRNVKKKVRNKAKVKISLERNTKDTKSVSYEKSNYTIKILSYKFIIKNNR